MTQSFSRPRPVPPFFGGVFTRAGKIFPGLWLVAILTAAAYGLRDLPGFAALSPMILGVVAGVVLCNLAPPSDRLKPGISFAGKGLLRSGVALLGLQVSLAQIAAIGAWGMISVAVALFATFFFTLWLGRILRVPAPLTTLIAAGTSVCGAAAIAGANSATRANDAQVTYAITAITLFGTIAMITYPLVGQALGLDAQSYGTWIGLSVHEVAQVVGAGFQGGDSAGQTAVITKIARVVLLAVLVMGLALRLRHGLSQSESAEEAPARPPLVPAFVLAFLGLSALNSMGFVPVFVQDASRILTPVLLTVSLSALGLGTRFDSLRSLGLRPMVLCGCASLFIAIVSLLLATA